MTAALLTLADSRLPAGGHTHSGGVEQAITAGLVTDPRTLEVFLRRRLTTSGAVAAGVSAAACRAVLAAAGRTGAVLAAADATPSDPGAARQPADPGPEPGADGLVTALAELDAETDARTPSPALRQASRQQGRGLVRVGRRAWPHPAWDALPDRPHHPVALGVAAAAGGLGARAAASAAAYLSITGPATAAQRLLAMDPITVATVTARLGPDVDAVAARAADHDSRDGPACARTGYDGPGCGGPAGGRASRASAAAPTWLPADTDPLLDLLAEVHADRTDRFFAS